MSHASMASLTRRSGRSGTEKPLAIDLFCGLGGWAEGFLSEGFRVIGFDIECHDYGTGGYPGQLVLQDVLTLHGSQFRDAAVIVASPPCQAYSYRAMPWRRAKALPPPSNELFDACFRIQCEASEAAGRYIPLVVENVKGAQKWVGRAAWHYGSFYLWGDVPALMPAHTFDRKVPGFNFHQHETNGKGGSFQSAAVKVAGLNWSGSDKPGYVAKAFNDTAVKNGRDWFGAGEDCSLQRRASSRSIGRKAASAQIAKIPFPLARWIAHVFKPTETQLRETA